MKLKLADFSFVIIQLLLFLSYILEVKVLMFNVYIVNKIIGIILTVFGGLAVIISLLQLNKNLSPFPTPKNDASLQKNGLYKYVRHPIYTGILLLLFGYGLYIGSGYKLMILLLLYVLFFYKSIYEEKQLSVFFEEYPVYKKNTGRFFPKLFLYNKKH